ncbi:hypothetical protein ACVIGB_001024 [Bradyrhizobium sp. USDA 4341]
MAWADTSIEITGEVRGDADLEKLVAAIVADRPTPSWSEGMIQSEAEAGQYLRDVLAAGQVLIFAENERTGETFSRIEAACREIGLGYVVTVSVDEEHDTPGHREIYNPATQKLERLPGMDDGFVSASDVLNLLEAGRLTDTIALLKHAISPAAGLPQGFSVAEGLFAEPAPQI